MPLSIKEAYFYKSIYFVYLKAYRALDRLVNKSLMVCRGEIVELWRYSCEITALAQTAGCRLLLIRPAVSREYLVNTLNRVGKLSNDKSKHWVNLTVVK